jgi:hypothetical protein
MHNPAAAGAASASAAAPLLLRIVAPMSDTEKLINKQLLEKVQLAGLSSTGHCQQSSSVVRTKAAAAKQQQQQQQRH